MGFTEIVDFREDKYVSTYGNYMLTKQPCEPAINIKKKHQNINATHL